MLIDNFRGEIHHQSNLIDEESEAQRIEGLVQGQKAKICHGQEPNLDLLT